MTTYEELAERLRQNGVAQRGVSEDAIAGAEAEIGALPNDYRSFLLDFGWAQIGHLEIFGLGAGIPHYLDLVAMTRAERTEPGLPVPSSLVPICNDGGGNLYCLSVEHAVEKRESPVFFWSHDDPDEVPDEMAPSFSAWLLDEVN